jgi:hypothetical protein
MKTEKLTLSGEKRGKVKLVIQTFKFAFLNASGKIKTVLIFLSGQTFPPPDKQWSLLERAGE